MRTMLEVDEWKEAVEDYLSKKLGGRKVTVKFDEEFYLEETNVTVTIDSQDATHQKIDCCNCHSTPRVWMLKNSPLEGS